MRVKIGVKLFTCSIFLYHKYCHHCHRQEQKARCRKLLILDTHFQLVCPGRSMTWALQIRVF